ncbi:MAG: Ubiquinone biosynthesis O-methyltransferase [Nitrosomonadaceae bacterium]|nr:Ubiquinone biosynthesis O-methyltransferase [Nitrosomonadaceae bacterium]
MTSTVDDKVIKEFGKQWNHFSEYSGHFASKDLLADTMGPLMGLDDLKGAAVAEIGSGNGRIVNMLIEAGVSKVLALEPSDAVRTLSKNVEPYGERVEVVQATGDQLPARNFDYVFCIGVMQHVSDPLPVLRAAREALKPGGKYFMWLYAKEGTEMYRALVMPFRAVTKRLPIAVLTRLSWALMVGLTGYIHLCKLSSKLPLSKYVTEVMGKVSPEARTITIYDQLNPTWVRYYSKSEVEKMMVDAGFTDVKTYHRHGYSWSVLGTVAPAK